MATLFNTKISVTYPGLLKTIDNVALSATLRELTDGSGNQSGLFLNTAGDFKVSAILEWGSLKDTGTGVTITQFVTAANGIGNFNNDTTVPTSAAVKLYVDTKFSQTDTLTEVLGFGNTTSGKDIAVSAGDDITFTDSSKILMGVGSDLQIYHDGSNSYIKDDGTGDLRIDTNAFRVRSANGSQTLITGFQASAVALYNNNTLRFETTTDGSKVTGNLVVTGSITGSGGSFLPLAGGTMTGNIVLNDNVKSIYGTANDGLEIFHDGFDSFITDSGTGKLWVLGSTQVNIGSPSYEIGIQYIENGSVNLRYDNSVKLATTSTGVSITGALSTTTNVSVGANATFVDNGKALFGNSNELEIYHDSTNNIIKSSSGQLKLLSNAFLLRNSADDETLLSAFANDTVILYNNNIEKFRTLGSGAKVTGNLEVTGTITGSGGSFLPLAGGTMTGNTIHNDNVKSIYGTGSDFSIYHDGSNSYIQDTSGTGDLIIDTNTFRLRSANGGETMIRAFQDSAVILSHNNLDKLATTSTGISVTGDGAFSGSVQIPNAGQLQLGTGNHMILQHNSANGFIKNLTGQLNIDQSAVTQSIVFRVSNANALDTTALTINREGDLTTGADVTIAGNLTVNGTTTTINTQTLAVEDPLIELSKDNAANSVDIGFYGKYNDGTARYLGLFSDASDSNKFRLFKGTTVQPTTTVNIAGLGYVAADLVVAGLEATTGVFSTSVTVTGTAPLLYINNTTSGTGKNWRFSSAPNGKFFITQEGVIDAITLDHTSGNASFSGDVSLGDDKKIRLGTGNDLDIYHNGTTENSNIDNNTGNLYISNLADDKDIFFRGKDGGSVITALTLDMSDGGTATFAGNVGIGSFPTSKLQLEQSIVPRITMIKTGVLSWYVGNPTQGSSGNFTIGTDSGSNLDILTLDTSGNATFAGNVIVGSTNPVKLIDQSYGGELGLYYGTTNHWKQYHYSDNSLRFNYNGSGGDELILANTGNATFAGDVTVTGGDLTLGTDAIASNINAVGDVLGINVDSNTGGGSGANIQLKTAGTSQLTINSSSATFAGNVGIGAAPVGNPGTNILAVGTAGSVAGGIQLWAGSTQTHFLQFGDVASGTGYYKGAISYAHSSDTLELLQDSVTALSITGSQAATFAGDVGVGAAPADGNLSIRKTGVNTGITNVLMNLGTAREDNTTGLSIGYRTDETTAVLAPRTTTGNLAIMGYDGGWGETARFTNTRKFTLGTPTPSSDSIMTLSTSASTGLSIISVSNTGESFINFGDGNDINAGRIYYGHTDNAMRFRTNDALRMLIDSSGNVGIGTGGYAQKTLDISGASGGQLLITSADDSVGSSAGILLRAEGGEANGLARVKGGIFFERIAGSFGNGDLKFAVNSSVSNDIVTVADTKMTIKKDGAINLGTIQPIGHNFTNGTITNGQSVNFNANVAGGNQAAGFMVISAVPNNVTAGGAVGIFTHIHTQGANIYTQLSKREEGNITISESGGVFTISNSSGSTVYYQAKTINMVDFNSTINGY